MSAKPWPVLAVAAVAIALGACNDTGQLEKTGNCPGCNLNRVDLQGADLDRANLIDAEFERADLQAANLVDADLEGAQLANANLRYANLAGANLSGANLRGANLAGADLRRTNFERANLAGADLRDIEWGQEDIGSAIAAGVPLWAEVLREAIMRQAEVEEDQLFEPDGAIDLDDRDLAKMLFISALIQGTDIAESQIQETLAPLPNFRNALYDRNTQFPNGFNPDDAQMREIE
ncbi:pentapeptide repeat-containing protein [Synechococcus sp. PCC 7336]|uniref:pentapeptide repeat-containing protein n=1 Tax=Synechococcus sp. PCC 7336 TaxID=195250 RepID=UPI00034B06A7|nr:pentapeptide repeat-containing protein [Synechococcus sp. PCC 7336]